MNENSFSRLFYYQKNKWTIDTISESDFEGGEP